MTEQGRVVTVVVKGGQDVKLDTQIFVKAFGFPLELVDPDAPIELVLTSYLKDEAGKDKAGACVFLVNLLGSVASFFVPSGEEPSVENLLSVEIPKEDYKYVLRALDYLVMEDKYIILLIKSLENEVRKFDQGKEKWIAFLRNAMNLLSLLLLSQQHMKSYFFEQLSSFLNAVWSQFDMLHPKDQLRDRQKACSTYVKMLVVHVLKCVAGSKNRPNGKLRLCNMVGHFFFHPDSVYCISACTKEFLKKVKLLDDAYEPTLGEMVMANFLQNSLLFELNRQVETVHKAKRASMIERYNTDIQYTTERMNMCREAGDNTGARNWEDRVDYHTRRLREFQREVPFIQRELFSDHHLLGLVCKETKVLDSFYNAGFSHLPRKVELQAQTHPRPLKRQKQ